MSTVVDVVLVDKSKDPNGINDVIQNQRLTGARENQRLTGAREI